MNSIVNYSLSFEKIGDYAKKIGRASARPVILLYYVLRSDKTPKTEKLLILTSLAYVVMPIDIISARRIPIVGWIDEITALTVAYQKIQKHVTPQMEADAEALLDKLFEENPVSTVTI